MFMRMTEVNKWCVSEARDGCQAVIDDVVVRAGVMPHITSSLPDATSL